MENIALESKEMLTTLIKQKDESPEKQIKDVGSNSNDETNDAESTEKIIDQNFKFYLEYCKLYEANITLNTHLNSLLKEKNQLKNEIQKLENKEKNIVIDDPYTNRKRHRRTKNEISRSFQCKFDGCNKNYGSEGSLNQHIKLKHGNIEQTKTQNNIL